MLTIKEAEEILKKEYHIDNFTYLMSDVLLPDFAEDRHEVAYNNQVFSSVNMLGSSNKCDITVFEVILNEGVQNRRVAITQEMFRILRGLRINNAVVAFVNEDRCNYRISLLTSKYEFDGDKIIKILSNPRRLSYSLGYGTKTKTAYKFLIEKGKVNTFDELVSRFSVEVVNKQFYSEIATAFTELVGGERNGRKYEKTLDLYSVVDHNKYSEFGVRLIGRIMFCWFLREKRSEKGIPLVPDSMLSIDTIKEGNYYHKVLEPLFFELLNTSQNRRKSEFKTGEYNWVPYLNGGLFSPQSDDHYKYDDINHCGTIGLVTIPDEWFVRLYSVLGEYNFTVDENTAYDIELSIDPEMLGRIFENLLAEINPETGENAKKSTGSFYTPRDIVDYMVDSSLLEYLKTKTEIDENRLRALISYFKENDEDVLFSKQEKKAIIDSFYTITTLDPACGSGAFPIGMLQKIVYILQVLDPEADLWFDKATENVGILLKKEFEKKFNAGSLNYIRKLSVIQNSIFGIDIQPIAVEISRLRCFLSLIIEEKVDDAEENRGVNALPNLDFKFIIANSLISLDNDLQGSFFEDVDHIEKLKSVREEYFNAESDRRSELKLEFSQIQQDMLLNTIQNYAKQASQKYTQLFSWKPFSNEPTGWFDPDWMFGIRGGFDVVIGNPPYISSATQQKDPALLEQRRKIIDSKKYRSLYYKWDLYIPFVEFGLDSLKQHGVLAMIVPYPFTNQIYAQKLREIVLCENNLIEIADLKDSKIFEATVQNCIPIISKATKGESVYVSYYSNHTINRAFSKIHKSLIQDNKTQVWNLGNEDGKRTYLGFYSLGDFFYISKGMVLNSDEKTDKGGFKKKDLISTQKDQVHSKKYIEGKDIEPFRIVRTRYLEWGTDRCPAKISRKTFEELYTNPKLLFNCLGELKVAIDSVGEYYCEQAIRVAVLWKDLSEINNTSIDGVVKKYSHYSRTKMESLSSQIDIYYILGIVNSQYATTLLSDIRGGDYHIVPEHIRKIPIPLIDITKQLEISQLVKAIILQNNKEAVNSLIIRLNQKVDEIYKNQLGNK